MSDSLNISDIFNQSDDLNISDIVSPNLLDQASVLVENVGIFMTGNQHPSNPISAAMIAKDLANFLKQKTDSDSTIKKAQTIWQATQQSPYFPQMAEKLTSILLNFKKK